MSKVQTPCVVCETPIHVAENSDKKRACCTSCKRKGEKPAKEKPTKRITARCQLCGGRITRRNVSLKTGICILCRIENEKPKPAEKPKVAYDNDNYLVPQEAFCGYAWESAVVNPVW